MKKRLLHAFFQRKQGTNRVFLRRRPPTLKLRWVNQQTSPLMVTQIAQMQRLGQQLIVGAK